MENDLKNQRYKFHSGFAAEVMAKIRNEAGQGLNYFIHRWQPFLTWSAAACIILSIGLLFLTEGSLSQDALIGVSDFTELELTELLSGY